MKSYNDIIIGSGQGGVPLAVDLAEKGRNVAVFERDSWGGTCINAGCTPSKAFLAAAHAAQHARSAERFGLSTRVSIQFPHVMKRVREIIQNWSRGVKDRLDKTNITLYEKEASFLDQRKITDGEDTYTADRVIINSGKSPFIPPVDGLSETPFITYTSFWNLQELPQRMIILGGGYTGVELGQGLARLGSEVHIVERNQRIIHREKSDVSQTVQEALQSDGVEFHFQSEVKQVSHDGNTFSIQMDAGNILEGDTLLVATGRKPNTANLEPEKIKIELDSNGHIIVDEHFQTSCPGVYAIGDVTGQPAFTHVSWEDYRRLSSIFQGKDRTRGDRPLAYAFFTDPQVGRVGMTLEKAQEEGYDAIAATLPLNHVARALETDQTRGFYRMVIDNETDRILGATLIGPEAAELIHIFIAHIQHQATWHDLDQAVHIHPAFAEALPMLARKFKS